MLDDDYALDTETCQEYSLEYEVGCRSCGSGFCAVFAEPI
jgi:hypothetical protein